jgi:hypothetical protein
MRLVHWHELAQIGVDGATRGAASGCGCGGGAAPTASKLAPLPNADASATRARAIHWHDIASRGTVEQRGESVRWTDETYLPAVRLLRPRGGR